MKFSVADLLDHLPASGSLETGKLQKILKLSNRSDKDGLSLALQSLEKLGLITCSDDELISRCTNEDLIEARLRCSSKGFCFAIREDGGEDIYVRDHHLNHAWNGDRVLVKITREGGRRRSPEGGVQCILERTTTRLLAQLEQQDERLVALPLDDRLLATIALPDADSSHLNDEAAPTVVEVAVDRFPVAQFPARGHVERPLPLDAGPQGDRELLLTKANLHRRADAPRSSAKRPSAKKRRDLTAQPSLLLRSWSAENAPCLPAVHVEPHDGGTRLWIHATAVAERFNPGSTVDLWLQDQGESLCLGDDWRPLLSHALNEASRFAEGADQDAITLRLDISADGSVSEWDFMLSRVCPVATVTPAALEALAARKPKARTVPAALKPLKDQLGQIETLLFCARSLHQHSVQNGGIELDLPSPAIESLGDLRWSSPDASRHQWISPLREGDPNSILSVFIRTADQCWAAHAADLGLPSLRLEAAEPDNATLTDVAKTAIALELPLELDDDGTPSASDLNQAFRSSPLRRMLDLQMRQALSDPWVKLAEPDARETAEPESTDPEPADNDQPQSIARPATVSLGSPWCCPTLHATDLINQQVLSALLNDGKDRPNVRHKEKLNLGSMGIGSRVSWPLLTASQEQKLRDGLQDRTLQRLNNRRRQLSGLEKDLVAMAQARSAEPMIGAEHQGRISGVQSYGFFVEIPPSMVEGMVHVSSLNDDWYEYRSRQNRLVGRRTRRVYQLGDEVTVRVVKVDILRNQIDLEIVNTGTSSADSDQPVAVSLSD